MDRNEDVIYMKRALALAKQAEGQTSPNPMVGAVLVRDGKVVGEGFHEKAGHSHAEVNAVAAAGAMARGATLYINLEPCCHHGKTPPCVDTLLAAGISRAVIAMVDPNPLVAGEGIRCLQVAGIECETGLLEPEAVQLNEVFIKYIQTRRPFVIMKTAMTLDGKIATTAGDSRWISNEKSRAYVHGLRSIYDAILVGIGTVIKDDPMLNTRLEDHKRKDPVRVIIDGNLDLPLESRIASTARDIRTLVYCSNVAAVDREKILAEKGLEIIRIAGDPLALDLERVLESLGQKSITSLMVEGGSHINSSFLEAKLVDKLVWFISPKILGGKSAPSPVSGAGVEFVRQALQLRDMEVKRFDEDLCLTGYLIY